ncbi:MAG: FKBP-type peptidyl-prolyl cis-trans isomerase [Deltaproteobacteria bacterium]|nr:FKBP-type peptidyl-prolyl cis-trans isomerase [Deltaproteobacteria bacterium]MBW2070295.1 FKBP-type peptidyl-prolyl cis-trans isomerase [Deltaproteobacteria bacterium]
MAVARIGDKVRVHFTGSLEDGTVFGSTVGEEPFEFIIGQKSVLPGFEEAVVGMIEGDTKTITLSPKEAYGDYRKDLLFIFERSEFPADLDLELGKRLQVRLRDGTTALVVVKNITEDNIVLDANDPLAGQSITFKITLMKIL